MTHNLHLGQRVINFGQAATIIAFHSVTGDPILMDDHGIKWLADAAKCDPVLDACIHHDGLVAFI